MKIYNTGMWSVLRSSKFFSQYSHCANLPLVTTSPGLPYIFPTKINKTFILFEFI